MILNAIKLEFLVIGKKKKAKPFYYSIIILFIYLVRRFIKNILIKEYKKDIYIMTKRVKENLYMSQLV